jgi:hypothetical protein
MNTTFQKKAPGTERRPPRLGRGARLEVEPPRPSLGSRRGGRDGRRRAIDEVRAFEQDRYPRASGHLCTLPDVASTGATSGGRHTASAPETARRTTNVTGWSRIRTCDFRVRGSVLYH